MDLTAALFDLCNSSKQPILAIDGPAGAGKTTLAEHLSAALALKYTVAIIHMDDLYNGWDNAFDFHLKDALISIVDAHRAKREISLSRFNWYQNEFGAAEKLAPADLLILEGVGSSQSAIRQNLTASIWIDIDRTIGLERVLRRDGEGLSDQMKNWLTLQENHFQEEESEASADFVLTTS